MSHQQIAADGLLHGLIECQAERTPERLAVVHDGRSITFGELNTRGNRVARALLETGIGERARVGTYLPKSIDLIISVLGILKCGAAFVPIDIRNSRQRSQSILSNARVDALLSGAALQSQVRDFTVATPILLEDLQLRAPECDTRANLALPLAASTLAWVFHTSGSTGRPKGVMGAHFNSVRRCECMWELQPTGPEEICAQQMPVGSIDWLWEVFAPLGKGLRVALIDTLDICSPQRTVEVLRAQEVTQVCLVPTHLSLLLESCSDLCRRVPRLKTWISTGEPLPMSLAAKFKRAMPEATLLNQFGLTETIATSTCLALEPTMEIGPEGLVPIGSAISAATARVLNDGLMEPARGEVGELYLGGDCLALGYLNQPALTAERFVPNPFGCGDRLYRSGDLASVRPDGMLQYRGRADRQIKVLGYRVEPAEVEAALLAIAGCTRAAAVAVTEGGQTALAAFVVCSGLKGPQESVRSHLLRELGALLPDYMIPASLTVLSALPTTANGKVDYLALTNLRPPLKPRKTTGQAVLSCAHIEGTLLSAWTQLLGVPSSMDSDFFDCGGDSVLAIRLSKRVGDELRIPVPVEAIYRHPSLRDLATALARHAEGIVGTDAQ